MKIDLQRGKMFKLNKTVFSSGNKACHIKATSCSTGGGV